MLDRETLEKLVMDIVPEPYTPKKSGTPRDPKDPWPLLTHVEIDDRGNIDKWLKRWSPAKNPERVRAVCINWGHLLKAAGCDDWHEKLHSRFISIRPDTDLSILGLSFLILHEVGHIHWDNTPEEQLRWVKGNEELFADMFAHDTLRDLYGIEMAQRLLIEYGSAEGFYKFTKETAN